MRRLVEVIGTSQMMLLLHQAAQGVLGETASLRLDECRNLLQIASGMGLVCYSVSVLTITNQVQRSLFWIVVLSKE